MVGMAVGAAMKGWKAVVMIAYADISSVCHKAIVQSAAGHYSHLRAFAMSRSDSSAHSTFPRARAHGQRSCRVVVLQRSGPQYRDAGVGR